MRLSICIPTYNRGQTLIHTLQQVLDQVSADVEIVVSNNASTDDTRSAVEQLIQAHPPVQMRLINQTTNVGFDRNVLALVAAARGEYCWLLSDDDNILPGGIAHVLQLIKQKPRASYVVNYQCYDIVKQAVVTRNMFNIEQDIDTTDVDAFYFRPLLRPAYFQILGTNMLTMSINVFQRTAWEKVVPNIQPYIGKNFIHIFALAAIMRQSGQGYLIAKPLVQYLRNHHRSWGNDIWSDYKSHFLPYLETTQYQPQLVAKLKTSTIIHRNWKERLAPIIYHFIPSLAK